MLRKSQVKSTFAKPFGLKLAMILDENPSFVNIMQYTLTVFSAAPPAITLMCPLLLMPSSKNSSLNTSKCAAKPSLGSLTAIC